MNQPGEPTVEEILESIKKVIARDSGAMVQAGMNGCGGAGHGNGAPHAWANGLDHDDHDDVLDLAASPYMAMDEQEDRPLVRENTQSSLRESLAALAAISQPGAQPQIVRSGETSLEQLTRDMLRPMLAEWLDKNLPPLVERLVADEIARIVGKRG